MFFRSSYSESQSTLDALTKSLALIEFDMDGTIRGANPSFLSVVGYELAAIRGQNHRIFVEDDVAESSDYATLWKELRSGEFVAGEFQRRSRSGTKLWLEATYNPVPGPDGRPFKVVKFASDVTAKKKEASRLLRMIDDMPVAVMTADPRNEFKIDYINNTSRKTLESIERYLPIKVSDMMGTSFDVFHKNPHHQRNMLADPSRLPHRTKIRVGPETLDLQVSAMTDLDGTYLGPMLTWSVITAQVAMAGEVGGVVDALGMAIGEMKDSAQGLNRSADEASARANSVAAGSEEMTSSIHEISGQVGRVSERTQQIANQAAATDATVRNLAANAAEVDTVVGMIKSIADQTNLLALNATIEAARAGAAGRGFAVVATEVKELAGQTARATGDITDKVRAIQDATRGAVTAIRMITDEVAELSKLTLAIASAVEEQAASTQEMSSNITGVSAAAGETGQLAEMVRQISETLAAQSAGLGASMEKFLKTG